METGALFNIRFRLIYFTYGFIIIFLCLFFGLASYAEGPEKYMDYEQYKNNHSDKDFADDTIFINAHDYTHTNMSIEMKKDFEGLDGLSIITTDEGFIEWELDVEKAGFYNIAIKYYPVEGKRSSIERRLKINGKTAFEELNNLIFTRVWVDAGDIKIDILDNELRPTQEQSPMWIETDLMDNTGYYNEPYRFYFTRGKHTVRFESIKEPMMIAWLKLYKGEPVLSYSEIEQVYKKRGYQSTKGQEVVIQAEKSKYKSDPTLYAVNDRTSPITQPYHASKIRLNTIGGERWRIPGQWITWEMDVPESGLYKIAVRFKQNTKAGLFTSRHLLINGKTPFSEAEKLRFNYDSKWQINTLGDGEKDYLFYLSKGKHEISLNVTLGDWADVHRILKNSVLKLNNAYRKILMITGPEPDIYRDYAFDRLIPDTLDVFDSQARILDNISAEFERINGEKGQDVVMLDKLAFQLEKMSSRPEMIASSFKNFKENVSGLGEWILNTGEQPLIIDYIMLLSPDEKLPKADAGFIKRMWHEIKAFAASFVEDYNTIGSINLEADKKYRNVTVWLSAGGRDQAQILKELTENSFTPYHSINANVQLAPAGSLLPAALAGIGPDIALQIPGGDVVNYAARNAITELSGFESYDDVAKRFYGSALVPYRYNEGVYALPETQTFMMMFYRKDIMEELGVSLPDTWKDVYDIIPVLQKKNLEFGYPMGFNGYMIKLMQNDGSLYVRDGVRSNLDSEIAIDAFNQWTELYTNYKLQITYNFINRFRTGEMPIGITNYTDYNQLTLFAPEIKGLWDFIPLPGTINENNNTIDRSGPGGGGGCIMLAQTEDKGAAWEFMKWWTEKDTQSAYSKELECIMGAAARNATANIEAMYEIPWPQRHYKSLMDQWEWVKGIPEVPGGYYTTRYLDFAYRRVVNDGEQPEETLLDFVRTINDEINKKRKEFGLSLY